MTFKAKDYGENVFEQIFIKSKVDYKMFQNYFHQEKDEYAIHNSFKFSKGRYLISGFGLLNLLNDYKIKFIQSDPNSNFILMNLTNEGKADLNRILEFYLNDINKDSDNLSIKNSFQEQSKDSYSIFSQELKRLHIEKIVVLKPLLLFYEKFSSYFSDIDNYFPMKESINKIACSCFFILSENENSPQEKFSNFFTNIEKEILLGEDITSLSSSLGVISYPHFSYSLSKGIISNQITEDIFLLDLRVLPNSHGALVYNKKKNPICLVLPVLNVKYSYTPLIYALRLEKLFEILKFIYSPKLEMYNKTNNIDGMRKFEYQYLSEIKTDSILIEEKFNKIKNSVFIIYTDKHYASCFYLGKGFFITNKHFFNNYELNDEEILVKNYKYTLRCIKYFIPKNNMDLAVVKIRNYEYEKYEGSKNSQYAFLTPLEISSDKVNLLDTIYSVTFSYFDRKEILNDLKFPNIFKGVVTKRILYKNSLEKKPINKFPQVEIVYGVDCACFSGGSGGPMINSEGKLVGVLFQNLTFHSDKHFLQLPHSGFMIAKEMVKLIYDKIDDKESLSNLWIFKLPNSEVDKYLNFNKFSLSIKPKF